MYQTLDRPEASPTLVGAALTMMVGAPAMYRFLDRIEIGPPPEKGKS
jgi:hypothetical protein